MPLIFASHDYKLESALWTYFYPLPLVDPDYHSWFLSGGEDLPSMWQGPHGFGSGSHIVVFWRTNQNHSRKNGGMDKTGVTHRLNIGGAPNHSDIPQIIATFLEHQASASGWIFRQPAINLAYSHLGCAVLEDRDFLKSEVTLDYFKAKKIRF